MGKQIRGQCVLKELTVEGLTVTFGRKKFKLSKHHKVSHALWNCLWCIFRTRLTVGLSVDGLLLKPPVIMPPKMIWEPSDRRAEEGYHL
jgi:hypothetical protein